MHILYEKGLFFLVFSQLDMANVGALLNRWFGKYTVHAWWEIHTGSARSGRLHRDANTIGIR